MRRDHHLLLIETENEQSWDGNGEKQAKIHIKLLLKTRFGAESFIWQEIEAQIRKVYQILVHPIGATLYLNRKTVKDTHNRLFVSMIWANFGRTFLFI